MRTAILVSCGLLWLAGCQSDGTDDVVPTEPNEAEPTEVEPVAVDSPSEEVVDPRQDPRCRTAQSYASTYEVAWMPIGGEVPKNRYFELVLWVYKQDELLRDASVLVSAEMPDHGHGMNVEPRTIAKDDGSFAVKGMLLHMAGYWELCVDVAEQGRRERTQFRIDLP